MYDCFDLESDPYLVAAAREFVRSRLLGWEMSSLVDDAVLLASELVTNAVLHARTAIQVRLRCNATSMRLEVSDENPRLPTTPSCPPEATSGRGLALVSMLASSWGIDQRDSGKVVWAELGPPTSWNEPDDCLDISGFQTVADAIDEVRRSNSEEAI